MGRDGRAPPARGSLTPLALAAADKGWNSAGNVTCLAFSWCWAKPGYLALGPWGSAAMSCTPCTLEETGSFDSPTPL